MTTTLIIFGIYGLAAFYSGFYFGYLKREGKFPESMPIVDDIKDIGEEIQEMITTPKKKKEEPPSFYD